MHNMKKDNYVNISNRLWWNLDQGFRYEYFQSVYKKRCQEAEDNGENPVYSRDIDTDHPEFKKGRAEYVKKNMSLESLSERYEWEIERFNGIGPVTMKELKDYMSQHGYTFKKSDRPLGPVLRITNE